MSHTLNGLPSTSGNISPNFSCNSSRVTFACSPGSFRFTANTARDPPGSGFAQICQLMERAGRIDGYFGLAEMQRSESSVSPSSPPSAHTPSVSVNRWRLAPLEHFVSCSAGPSLPSTSRHRASPPPGPAAWSSPSGVVMKTWLGAEPLHSARPTGHGEPASTQRPSALTTCTPPSAPGTAWYFQPRCDASVLLHSTPQA
mmetsp:Transcript_17277/g.46098  ORF Transcript_17277/g.46098 Transcript_17277/m.46098 type:complete len:200 (+) Transcript_17277:1652-2251(+)